MTKKRNDLEIKLTWLSGKANGWGIVGLVAIAAIGFAAMLV